MNLFERFVAGWKAFTGAELTAIDGKPELTEENVAALEAAASELENAKTSVEALKGENQAHAERITALEEVEAEASAAVAIIADALEANNVEVADGANIFELAAEKVNAWGKTVPPATATVNTDGDDIDAGATEETFLSDVDRRARERFNRNKK